MNVLSRQTVVDRYQQGKRDFSGTDLYQLDLSQVKLPGMILKNANLTGCNFARSDLRGVDFSAANLSQANLEEVDLRGANLQGVNLRRSNLRGAILDSDALESAILTGCILPNGNIFVAGISIAEQLIQPEVARSVAVMPIPKEAPIVYEAKVRSRDQFFQDLPRIPLASLGLGFLFFGLHFAILKANILIYVVMLLALAVSCYRTKGTSLLPILGLILLMLSGELPLAILIFSILIFFVIFVYVIFYGYRPGESIASIAFVGGLPVVIMFCYNLAIGTITGYSFGIVLAAFLATGFGSLVPIDMETRKYPRSEILQVTQMVGAIGLAIGGAIGLLVLLAAR
jgi:Pentapeptide repeats (8 copies)